MRVTLSGAGPPLVMIHGWAMSQRVFAPVMPALEARYTVHAIDLPGHGSNRDLSGPFAPDALALGVLDRVPHALWLGWSLGGLVALEAALAAPTRVAGAVLLAATPRFLAAPDWPHGVDAAVLARFAGGLARDWRATVQGFLALEVRGSIDASIELALLKQFVDADDAPSPAALAAGLVVLATADLRARLSALAVPTLWIAGGRDRLVHPESMRMAAAQARGDYVVLPGVGHAPFLTRGAALLDALERWQGAPRAT